MTNTRVALLKGDGIGPEIIDSVVEIFDKLSVPVEWETLSCGEQSLQAEASAMPESTIARVGELGLALKGPTATPIGKGHVSANVTLRKRLDLYANVRPAYNLPFIATPFNDVNLVVVRENTEGLYTGEETMISPDEAQCIKRITRKGSERIVRYAFELAQNLGRDSVTCVQKANIMKLTDGLLLEVFREVSKDYSKIEARECLVDAAAMQLVKDPGSFDVIVTENLYGDILSDLCAGLVGGLGVAGGANIGEKAAVFEAVHGTAPDIAGKGVCNPTAMILSSVMLLEHIKLFREARRLRQALFETYSKGKSLTRDLGGKAGTEEFSQAVIEHL